jgi:hypothetical protein
MATNADTEHAYSRLVHLVTNVWVMLLPNQLHYKSKITCNLVQAMN